MLSFLEILLCFCGLEKVINQNVALEKQIFESDRIGFEQRDIQAILNSCRRDTIVLRAVRGGCTGGGSGYGIRTMEVKTYNEQQKSHTRYHIVQKVGNLNVSTTGKTIYPGDIVTHLDDVAVESLTQAMMKTALTKTKAEVKVTIAAISPLRKRRPSYTRLHETVMTDTNVETPSSDAFVNDGKTE